MKKCTIIIIFLALAMLKIQAQDYLISFAGAGETTVVGTVRVANLTSGDTLILNGGDILHLSATVGIDTPVGDCGSLQIYPNPLAEQSTLTFVAPESGNAVISIIDLSGKNVYQISPLLSTGTYSFRISGISRGMYFVKVSGKTYNYSTKLISKSNLQGEARIEYVSSVKITKSNQLKSTAATIDMKYFDGDQLLYKGISGIYSTIVPDVPTSSKTITFNFVACTDADGNNYATVRIGTGKSGAQTWMAENLKVGVRINGTQDQTNNGIIEKYCAYDLETNCNINGGLYQWDEMMQYVTTEGVKGICLTGWHIPTDMEWITLTTYLGGEPVAGGKMKSTGTIQDGTGLWNEPNTGATNSSGFTVLPFGYRWYLDGTFWSGPFYAFYWSSSQYNAPDAFYRSLHYDTGGVYRDHNNKNYGYAVRCVQN